MRHYLQARYPKYAAKVKIFIGDVRDPRSLQDAMPGVYYYIFHVATLKQVPSCKFFPIQAVKTNVERTDNVLHATIDAEEKWGVCLSTDKAAYPINAMGISKAMMEHVIYANAREAAERGGGDAHLLHTLRQCHVQPWERDSTVHRLDKREQSHHHHKSRDDTHSHEFGCSR